MRAGTREELIEAVGRLFDVDRDFDPVSIAWFLGSLTSSGGTEPARHSSTAQLEDVLQRLLPPRSSPGLDLEFEARLRGALAWLYLPTPGSQRFEDLRSRLGPLRYHAPEVRLEWSEFCYRHTFSELESSGVLTVRGRELIAEFALALITAIRSLKLDNIATGDIPNRLRRVLDMSRIFALELAAAIAPMAIEPPRIVERAFEPKLIESFDQPDGDLHLVVGDTGLGKSTLLLSLHHKLEALGKRPLLISATWLKAGDGPETLSWRDLAGAAFKAQSAGLDVVILLDSLDTLMARESDVLRLRELLDQLADQGVRLIATSRPVPSKLDTLAWRRWVIEPLTGEELVETVRSFARAYCPHADLESLTQEFEHEFARSKGDAIGTPLLLRMAFELASPLPPTTRIDEGAVFARFWSYRVESDVRSPFESDDGSRDVSGPAMRIAVAMSGMGLSEASLPELQAIVEKVEGFPPEPVGRATLQTLAGRGLLMNSDSRARFSHQSLLEYSTARALLRRGGELEIRRLVDLALEDPLSAPLSLLRQVLLLASTTALRTVVTDSIVALISSESRRLRLIGTGIWGARPGIASLGMFEFLTLSERREIVGALASAEPHDPDMILILRSAWSSGSATLRVAVLRTMARRAPAAPDEVAELARQLVTAGPETDLAWAETWDAVEPLLTVAEYIVPEAPDEARAIFFLTLSAPVDVGRLRSVLTVVARHVELFRAEEARARLEGILNDRTVTPSRGTIQSVGLLGAMARRPSLTPSDPVEEVEQLMRLLSHSPVSLATLVRAGQMLDQLVGAREVTPEHVAVLDIIEAHADDGNVRQCVVVPLLESPNPVARELLSRASHALRTSLRTGKQMSGLAQAALWEARRPGVASSFLVADFRRDPPLLSPALGRRSLAALALASAAESPVAREKMARLLRSNQKSFRAADAAVLFQMALQFSFDADLMRAALILAARTNDVSAIGQLVTTRVARDLFEEPGFAKQVVWSLAAQPHADLRALRLMLEAAGVRVQWDRAAARRTIKTAGWIVRSRNLHVYAEWAGSRSVLEFIVDELEEILRRLGEPRLREVGHQSPGWEELASIEAVLAWLCATASPQCPLPDEELARLRIGGAFRSMERRLRNHGFFADVGALVTRFAESDRRESVGAILVEIVDSLAHRLSRHRWAKLIWPHLRPAFDSYLREASDGQISELIELLARREHAQGLGRSLVEYLLIARPETEELMRSRNLAGFATAVDDLSSPPLHKMLLTAPRERSLDVSEKCDIGVVTILPVETRAVRDWLQEMPDFHEEMAADGRWFYRARVVTRQGPRSVVAIQAKTQGPISTTVAHEILLREFAPRIFVLLGIAGGVHPDVSLGDVVLADQVIDYSPRAEFKESVSHRGVTYPISTRLRGMLNHFASTHPSEMQIAAGPASRANSVDQFAVHVGPIGSGHSVVKSGDAETRRWLAAFNDKTLALETEGNGAATFVHETNGVGTSGDLLVVRGISDHADLHKSDAWHRAASENATLALRAVLDSIPDTLLDPSELR